MNLFLTGFMGSGKTTTGRCLAQRLDLPFLDTDALIEAETQQTIADIFATQGEAAFRLLERELCTRLPDQHVIALGGGTFMDEANRTLIKQRGYAVFLEWPFSVLAERIEGDLRRPLSADRPQMRKRYQARLPIYRDADLIWRSRPPHQATPDQVAARIEQQLPQALKERLRKS